MGSEVESGLVFPHGEHRTRVLILGRLVGNVAWGEFTDGPTNQNPVYSARIAFTAGTDDTVDIDLVAVNAPEDIVNVRWIDKQTMAWDASVSAAQSHVYGGLISDLSCTYFGACQDDLDPDLTDTILTDTGVPLAGEGWFYVVTAEGPTGIEGSPGASSCGVRLHAPTCP